MSVWFATELLEERGGIVVKGLMAGANIDGKSGRKVGVVGVAGLATGATCASW